MEILCPFVLLAIFIIILTIIGKIKNFKENRKERRRARFEHKARG